MVRAIDVHVHVPQEPGVQDSPWAEQMRRYFRSTRPQSPEDMARTYKELDILGVLFSLDAETATGLKASSNDWVAGLVRRWPEQFIGFASVDPWKGAAAVREVERCVKDLGLRGLKMHPPIQAFFPNETRFYPLWAKCSELGIPVLFHTGHSGVGSGVPGGAGIKLKYGAPIPYIDDVAADFPNLTIIMAHPSWPWTEEQISVAVHKANVFIDLSGWAPQYFPPALVREISSRLKDKVLFGSDYPSLPPERWLKEFGELQVSDEVRPKVLKENAKRVLKLDIP